MFSSTAITWRRALVALAFWAIGCSPGVRNEPTLEEKCEALETYCVDLPETREDLASCYDVGRRGLREPVHADRCFVAYDECFDDCYYLYLAREEARDGG